MPRGRVSLVVTVVSILVIAMLALLPAPDDAAPANDAGPTSQESDGEDLGEERGTGPTDEGTQGLGEPEGSPSTTDDPDESATSDEEQSIGGEADGGARADEPDAADGSNGSGDEPTGYARGAADEGAEAADAGEATPTDGSTPSGKSAQGAGEATSSDDGSPGARADTPDAGGTVPLDLEALLPSEGEWELWEESKDLTAAAHDLLVTYRDRGDCALAYSGYLDLLGKVWGCVVCGGDWVDVCVVSEEADGESSEVRRLVYDAEEVWERMEDEREEDK